MERDGGCKPNPWHSARGRGMSSRGTSGRASVREATDLDKRNGGGSQLKCKSKSNAKFEEARMKMQQAAEKHMMVNYESSDEEEELEVSSILGSVLQSYSAICGGKVELGRTQHFLEDVFQSGAATCLICIGSVKRIDPVWSCEACYCFLHLSCMQRWAKDSLLHLKQALQDLPRDKRPSLITWPCPKCRKEYDENTVPQKYMCFCGQKENPPNHPWLVPHSCGEPCGRPLLPLCGHNCLLLCHPGPCPPCPKTVRVKCHCSKEEPRPQRCSQKLWSCGNPCGAILSCGSHRCATLCHPGICEPCPKTSDQYCACGRAKQKRPCASSKWQCDNVCGKELSCGHHHCEKVCHSGPCGQCPLTDKRSCPCGKRMYELPCTDEVLPCGDTCGLVLNCGAHTCPERCHRDKCGTCLEVTLKRCRCGLHQRELPCAKEFLCETKCKRYKDCGRHPCNRKCCDSQCPPCEKLCGRTLPCGQHKCESVCHRGPCYPCPLTASVHCNCGSTFVSVPCGRQRRTRPPRCSRQCINPPDCHHLKRIEHSCHFGSCPPCSQTCNKTRDCGHICPKSCHSAVWMKVEQQAPAGPWELVAPQLECRNLPCPPCLVPVPVVCFGGHEKAIMECYNAKSLPCGRKCGRILACQNHVCSLDCHCVNGEESCEICENMCSLPRPAGCSHECLLPCHPAPCPPCRAMPRPRCHCAVTQLFITCSDLTKSDVDREALLSCGNPCPKSFPCGHKCMSSCHAGECPKAEMCAKKTKVYCPCRRIKKDVRCDLVRFSHFSLTCDEICEKQKSDKEKALADEVARQRQREEEVSKLEAERFQKKLEGASRRKSRVRRTSDGALMHGNRTYYYLAFLIVGVVLGILSFFQWK